MLRSATERRRLSALVADRAVMEARHARAAGTVAVVVARHQAANATLAQTAVAAMLAEQSVDAPAQAALNSLAFTTSAQMLNAMVTTADDAGFDRLVRSLVQDAGRAAETVAVAARPRVGWVRHLTPPSCSRCVVLAGRVYRYSDGFMRHPGDDCTTTAVSEGDTELVEDPVDLMRRGLVRGLSKADKEAILAGADFNQVVNVRRAAAGLASSGRVLARRNRPTPEGIFRIASDRDQALELLQRFGYLLP